MPAYTATFSDGFAKTLKNSTRTYAAAWRFKLADGRGGSGFARTRDLAQRAMNAHLAMYGKSVAVAFREVIDVTATNPA